MKTKSYRCLSQIGQSIAILVISVLFLCNPINAGEIDLSWELNLSSSDLPLLTTPKYESMWDGLGVRIDTRGDFIDVGMVDARLEMESSRTQSYTIGLPFDIHISAPDYVAPGQRVFLDSYAVLSGPASFKTSSDINYNTNLSITTRDVPIIGDNDISVPLPNVGANGVSVKFNGNASYTEIDTSADKKLTRTIWKNDPYDNPLNMARATQFEGYELHTKGDVDAWEAKVDVLQFAGNFAPALTPISAAMDISIGAGLDIIEENYLQTQFVTGYYTDDGGATYDDFLINGAKQRGWLDIPANLGIGETYNIQMTALGLGFSALTKYFLQGNIDVDLELLSLFNVGLGEIDIGSAIEVEDWITRYQIANYMNPAYGGFLTEEEFLAAVLSFIIDEEPTGEGETKDTSWQEFAQADDLIGRLIESGADENQLNLDFTLNPQPGPSVITHDEPVPEPATIMLLGCGLLGLAIIGRCRSKKWSSLEGI